MTLARLSFARLQVHLAVLTRSPLALALRCIFDPATYYGHHEAEWGMSWCASLGPAFWQGYRELIPEDEGFRDRAVLYELYHKLNHYNLFGGGYGSDALGLMGQLARIGDERLKGVAM